MNKYLLATVLFKYFKYTYQSFDICAIRVSGLIPVIPLTVISEILNFQYVLMNKRSITDTMAGLITGVYTQPDKLHMQYVLYYTKNEVRSSRPSPATRGGRATGIISEI